MINIRYNRHLNPKFERGCRIRAICNNKPYYEKGAEGIVLDNGDALLRVRFDSGKFNTSTYNSWVVNKDEFIPIKSSPETIKKFIEPEWKY